MKLDINQIKQIMQAIEVGATVMEHIKDARRKQREGRTNEIESPEDLLARIDRIVIPSADRLDNAPGESGESGESDESGEGEAEGEESSS